jgi:hypothetical protein
MLTEQGFAIIYRHGSKLELEVPAGARGPLADNAERPQCKGVGRVPMSHGLRDKEPTMWRVRMGKGKMQIQRHWRDEAVQSYVFFM